MFHCDRVDGGPGSLDVLAWERVEAGAAFLLIEVFAVGPFLRITGPKSLIIILLSTDCTSSIGRLPSEDEARVISGLASAFFRLGSVDVKAESVDAELKRPLALREGMLLVLMLRMVRLALPEVRTSTLTSALPAGDRIVVGVILEALCRSSAARKENFGEDNTPIGAMRCCCCCGGFRFGEAERD